jgi:hypothetical protein
MVKFCTYILTPLKYIVLENGASLGLLRCASRSTPHNALSSRVSLEVHIRHNGYWELLSSLTEHNDERHAQICFITVLKNDDYVKLRSITVEDITNYSVKL